jgi:predicted glycosyltransferase
MMLKDNITATPKAKDAEFKSQEYEPSRKLLVKTPRAKIWIDLDNTPHVPFFIPIIRELERRGYQVVLTARDAFQVCELADKKGIRYTKTGRHYGKNSFLKVFGLFWRSLQFLPFYFQQRPDLALSHGARSQILLCNLLRTPSVLITDYEHGRTIPMAFPKWLIVPESIFGYKFPVRANRLRFFHGIKEDVYVPEFKPDLSFHEDLCLRHDELVITVRPPATEAFYHSSESDVLLVELMSRIFRTPGVRAVLLPRNHEQEQALRTGYPEWFKDAKTVIPPRAVDGLDLIWLSDLVVSGGGTMNREAAALGVPVYSIFRGKTAAVDLRLEKEGRLTLIRSAEEVWTKIHFTHRDKNLLPDNKPRPALNEIINYIEEIVQAEGACE